jgi:predicted DNA-binding protein with PD1-like motif
MTVSTSSTDRVRHLLLRVTQSARLPDAILGALRDEVVLAGWMRASGVLSGVQIRVAGGASAGAPQHIDGVVQLVTLEGSIGLANGDVSCGMRAVLARETAAGLETIAGELVEARVEALEVLIASFDDVTATRQLDPAGVWVLDASAGAVRAAPVAPAASPAPPVSSPPAVATYSAPAAATPASGFAEAVRADAARPPERAPEPPKPAPEAPRPPPARPSPTFSATNNAMPQRIAKPVVAETEDDPVPEPGDTVEHFAFGQCEVVKSDGDRLHVRLGKDQRIKEIALEMLKVTALPASEGQTSRHWKLARKL